MSATVTNAAIAPDRSPQNKSTASIDRLTTFADHPYTAAGGLEIGTQIVPYPHYVPEFQSVP